MDSCDEKPVQIEFLEAKDKSLELPPGTEFVSITPHGVSSFNETWRIETILDGEVQLYFMKVESIPAILVKKS